MPDREHEDLEKELRDLGPRIDYPPIPDVARTVRRRLGAEPAQRRGPRAFATPGWIAAAAATILLSLILLSPAIRSTVPGSISSGASGGAGQAGGGGAGASDAGSAEYAAEPPTHSDGEAASGGAPHEVPDEAAAGASAGTSASPPSQGLGLGLGEEIPASEARARMGKLLLPETPELPDEPGMIHARGPSEADGVVLVFGPGPGLPPLSDTDVGLLLVEVPGDLETVYPPIAGASGPPTEEVDVGGHRGYWLPDGRLLRSQPGDGLPGGALLWEQDGTALLLRANVTREEAIRIAGTIR